MSKRLKTLISHSGGVFCIKTYPNGLLISGSRDEKNKTCNIKAGIFLKTVEGHKGDVRDVKLV